MTNDELIAAWRRKLPNVEPTDRELSAFALGTEVARDALSATSAEQRPVASADERRLRRLLCIARHGRSAYMDDGEASDASEHPSIDYLRDSLDEIEAKWVQRARAKIDRAIADAAAPVAIPSGAREAMEAALTALTKLRYSQLSSESTNRCHDAILLLRSALGAQGGE